jgi:hypothetical protein
MGFWPQFVEFSSISPDRYQSVIVPTTILSPIWCGEVGPPETGSVVQHPIRIILECPHNLEIVHDFGKPPWDFYHPWPPNHRVTV